MKNDAQQRLISYFNEHAITPYQISKRTPVPQSTIADYINGKTADMRSLYVMTICDAYDISPIWAFFGEGPEKLSDLKRSSIRCATIGDNTTNSNVVLGDNNTITPESLNHQVNDTTVNVVGSQNTTVNADQSDVVASLNKTITDLRAQIARLNDTIATQANTNNTLTIKLLELIK